MSEEILLLAAQWHLQSEQDDMDWDGFTDWLEADPAHRQAYDAIALDSAWLESHRDQVVQRLPQAEAPAPERVVPLHRRRAWLGLGGGLAAAAALALAFMPAQHPAAVQWQSYAAPDGGVRVLALGDGVRVVLGRNARLEVSSADPQTMRLAGSAYFDVAHRPDRRLSIQAGNYRITDIGTRFEIATSPKTVRVAVAEGAVDLTSQALSSPVRLSAGQGAVGYQASGTLQPIPVTGEAVGSFQRGVLVYQDVPLNMVAAELASYAGAPIHVDPALGDRRFSGALPVGNGKGLANNLAILMDLKSSERNGTIYLSAPDRP